LKSGLTYNTNNGTCVLITWRNQLVLFGNLFCNFGVVNMWLFMWHIQDMLAWCTYRPPFRWWPPFWHPLSQIFWCTFPTFSIVTRLWQQPFERFEVTQLDMNVLTIDWNFIQNHFYIYFNFGLQLQLNRRSIIILNLSF
jgi:hypothetical protein